MSTFFIVTASVLNLRIGPNLSTDVIAVLKRGQRLIVLLKTSTEWWEVKVQVAGQTLQGYVNSNFIKPTDPLLSDIADANISISFKQLSNNFPLVFELQTRLRNLGFYPGGQWLDSQIGSQQSFTWKGWQQFCSETGLPEPSTAHAIDSSMAKTILITKSVPSVFARAKNILSVKKHLSEINLLSPRISSYPPFSDRGIQSSPFEAHLQGYPNYLAAMQPIGSEIISHGQTLTLTGETAGSVSFNDFPDRGVVPTIDTGNLDFLPKTVSKACLCVGSFVPGVDHIKCHWLGKDPLIKQQYLSSTKFFAPLAILCKIGQINPSIDIDDCEIGFDQRQTQRTHNFVRLMEHMVSYEERKIASSNSIATTFARFFARQELETWLKNMTGNADLSFRGYYNPREIFIKNPILIDKSIGRNEVILRDSPEFNGINRVSSYDLVRIISMLGWHLHLQESARLPGAEWICLESMVRAMGFDPARYVDIAFETLGVVDHIANPVVISKLGSGSSEDTCVAFVSFVDIRTTPGRLHTLSFALHASGSSRDVHDVDLAVAVTEIIRRTMALELA